MPNITIEWMPPEERNNALGRYMDAFGRLEGMIQHVTREILQIDLAAANAISATLGTKQAIELLEAAGKLHFTEEGAAKVTRICQRLGRRNMRRNHIVHGHWAIVITVTDDGHSSAWTRIYNHTDPTLSALHPHDPKLAGLYTFTVPELDKASDHVEEMVEVMSALMEDIPSLRVPPQTREQSDR